MTTKTENNSVVIRSIFLCSVTLELIPSRRKTQESSIFLVVMSLIKWQNEDLSSLAEEARTLKDEMDVLRHTSDKVHT